MLVDWNKYLPSDALKYSVEFANGTVHDIKKIEKVGINFGENAGVFIKDGIPLPQYCSLYYVIQWKNESELYNSIYNQDIAETRSYNKCAKLIQQNDIDSKVLCGMVKLQFSKMNKHGRIQSNLNLLDENPQSFSNSTITSETNVKLSMSLFTFRISCDGSIDDRENNQDIIFKEEEKVNEIPIEFDIL